MMGLSRLSTVDIEITGTSRGCVHSVNGEQKTLIAKDNAIQNSVPAWMVNAMVGSGQVAMA